MGSADLSEAELEIIDGSTVTTTELEQLATVGATTVSANQWIALGGLAETLIGAEVNILDGVTDVTAAELSYIGDVTSAIQAQIDLKAPLASPTFTGAFTTPGIDDNADAIAITIDVTTEKVNMSAACDVVGALSTTSFSSSGGAVSLTLDAAQKVYIDAGTDPNTQTAGGLDIDYRIGAGVGGNVALDVALTSNHALLTGETIFNTSLSVDGHASDHAASTLIGLQLGAGATGSALRYGLHGNDTDFDYFIFNDATTESRFDGEVHFTNNATATTFGLVTTDADVVLAFDAVTNQGSITYMEDEDRFDFDNDLDVIGDLTANTIVSDVDLSVGGAMQYGAAGSVTIATGAIAVTKTYHTIVVEGGTGVGADQLDTATGGAEGDILILKAATTGANDQVTIADGTGADTFILAGAANFVMDTIDDRIMLIHNGTEWVEISRSDN